MADTAREEDFQDEEFGDEVAFDEDAPEFGDAEFDEVGDDEFADQEESYGEEEFGDADDEADEALAKVRKPLSPKTTLLLMSLVAAVPAVLLIILLVSAILKAAGQAPATFLALAGGTLLVGSAVAFIPFGVVVFGPKSKPSTDDETDGEMTAEAAIIEESASVEEVVIEEEIDDASASDQGFDVTQDESGEYVTEGGDESFEDIAIDFEDFQDEEKK